MEAAVGGAQASAELAQQVLVRIQEWLAAKGQSTSDGKRLQLRSGRFADLERSELDTACGQLAETTLTEVTATGWFRTTIRVAQDHARVVVNCEMSAGTESLMPLWVDVHCPKVLREILATPADWSYGQSKLDCRPQVFRDYADGDRFIDMVWNPTRTVPVVAVSEEYGLLLHPGIAEAMAADLAGLAVVAQLTPDAAWRVTSRKDKSWSCYGGAIRLYWPGLSPSSRPIDHPLWTARRLLLGLADTESASGRIRSQLRRRILGQSAFAIREHVLTEAIRRASRDEQLASLRNRISASNDYRPVAEEYFEKIVQLDSELASRDEEIKALKAQVSNLQLTLLWRDESPDAVLPVEEAPPPTVEDAVLLAMEKLDETLIFGRAVDAGIRSLAVDAGPPDKIWACLEALSELTEARRRGPLGNSAVGWLQAHGINASGESETIRNSPSQMRARTWDNGSGEQIPFETHLKPSDATALDRCVRIYFDYDNKSQRTLIGWVGRHP